MDQHSDEKKCRCRGCGTVLAHQSASTVTIRRNGLEVVLDEAATLKLRCYFSHCRAVTELQHPPSGVHLTKSSGPCR